MDKTCVCTLERVLTESLSAEQVVRIILTVGSQNKLHSKNQRSYRPWSLRPGSFFIRRSLLEEVPLGTSELVWKLLESTTSQAKACEIDHR